VGETTPRQIYTGCTVTSIVPSSGSGLLDAAEWYTMATRSISGLMCSHYLSAIVRKRPYRWVDVEPTSAGIIRPEAILYIRPHKIHHQGRSVSCCKRRFRGYMEMYISNAMSPSIWPTTRAVNRSETIVDFAASRILNHFTLWRSPTAVTPSIAEACASCVGVISLSLRATSHA